MRKSDKAFIYVSLGGIKGISSRRELNVFASQSQQYFQIINFQLYFFAKYHLNTLLFVYNFLGTRETKKTSFFSNRPQEDFDWLHQGVASRISVARIVADDDQNVTVETSDSRACATCTHVISFHAPGGATGSNSSGGGRGVGSFTGAVREKILQRRETREKSW